MITVETTKDLENKKLVIEFTVPTEKHTVWQYFATKDGFEQWWGPEGWETTALHFDFTPGGRIHYAMKCVNPEITDWFGKTSHGVMEIKTINAEHDFSYQDFFANEAGEADASMPALLVSNEFHETDDGTTKVASTTYGDTAEQIEQLIAMGMIEGFTSQVQRLSALV